MARLGRARPIRRPPVALALAAAPIEYVDAGTGAVRGAGAGFDSIVQYPTVAAGVDQSVSLGGTVAITPTEVAGTAAITDRVWRVVTGP